jgi:LPS export ABC transporter protein LptC/lipopolysaccharide transport protein LptA
LYANGVRLERLFTHRLVRLFRVVLPLVVISLIAIPTWNYFGKLRQKPATARQGRQLPSGVSVHTDGFKFSQTEKGRTSYIVRAKTYLGVKDNKSMLEDVDVTVYGATEKDPTRTIRGKHCTYDQDTSDFDCKENVQIQLDPRTTIYTDELVYNHRDSIAASPRHAHLEQEGTTGEADRFDYGVNSGLLKLYGHVKIDTPQQTELQTDSAIFQQNEHWATMAGGVYIQSPSGWIRGTSGRAELTPETFKPRVITIQDNVTGESHPQTGRETLKVRGDWLNATISPEGDPEKVLTRGNAEIEKIAGDQHQRLTGAEIDTTFNAGKVDIADARQNARMIMGNDQSLESAEIWTNAGGTVKTQDKSVLKLGDSTIEGREFHIENAEDVVTFDTPRPATLKKEGDQESAADRMNARFDSRTNMLIELVQTGHFQFRTPQYQGHAQRGTFKDGGNIVVLDGAPVVNDSEKHIEAAQIQLNEKDNSFIATRNVSTLLKNSDQQTLVKAARAEGGAESMLYTGSVQLWRGDTYIKADRLTASGKGEQNSKVYAEAVEGGKVQSTLKNVRSSSDTLDYDEAAESIHYTGRVHAQKQDMIVEAPDVIVHFHDQNVTDIVATGGVKVTREDQIGNGERATYDAMTDIVTLTGKNAHVYDPEHGTTQGATLTMRNKDKNVLVQSGNGERTVTQHRVRK